MFDQSTTPQSVKGSILSGLSPAFSTVEGSYTDTMAGGVSLEVWKLWEAMRAVNGCIATTKDSPQEVILGRCNDCGIVRKAGAKATATLTITGDEGVAIAKGKRFLTPSGLEYTVAQAVSITDGTAAVSVEAVEIGAGYNQPAGRITIQMESQVGIVAVTAGAATGGTEQESLESLVTRYHLFLQKPATSANIHQYEQWALEVDGVGATLVQPLVNGPGTVGVVLAGTDLLPVDSAIVSRCKAYIDTVRPADAADVQVSSAAGVTVNVTAQVKLSTSTTKDAVATELKAQLIRYCKDSIALKATSLPYAKVGYLLMGIDGVEDYSNLLLNGNAANVVLAVGQVPVVGEVVFK